MAILSEMLGFKHHDCARGSTVERAFLEDLAEALGGDGSGLRTKDDVLALCLRLSTGSADRSLLSNGETVKNEALDRIIEGVREQDLDVVGNGSTSVRIALAEEATRPHSDPFDPLDLSDERKISLRAIRVRSGQARFREMILRAYGSRCAVTGCDVQEVLEAAHIRPHRGARSNVISNGICLRADLHRLWDTGRLAVHESTLKVLLSESMVGTDYSSYVGQQIRLPPEPKKQPSSLALEQQRRWCGL
jgi:hypothetical protein